ncbi:flagellar protein [Cohnella sp. CFH 77786]|uniref:flagellar biosynthetic protein FliO n=1 Tax=Cohnella sp. CFH 77786 TaxID=2662265 RepID=UPI001C610457|nr:flagellar biosynthetic protein FliO [Cohnella sp. CFH 77786]MBW5444563.1 flagellar protein [Cohnella sp. CFH 77786]
MKGFYYAGGFADNGPAGSVWDLLWILFVLAVIVGLIILLLRFLAKRNRGWGTNRSLRSLGGFPLGTNKSMQIVEWNGRIYVLGVGEDVTLLESITDPETVASLLAEHDSAAESSASPLPEWLRSWTRKFPSPEGGKANADADARESFEKTLENRLRELAERRQRAERLLEEKPNEDRSGHP